MKRPLTPREIQRWYPERWSEIAGNAKVIEAWWNFLVYGPCNVLITGPSRTCKTRLITLGIRTLLCNRREADQNPCGQCSPCKLLAGSWDSCTGVFRGLWRSEYSYYPIDCEKVTADELRCLHKEAELHSERSIIYLDEVAALRRRELEPLLLKQVDESRATWIASAIAVRKRLRRGRTRVTEGLSVPMQGRFGMKLGTSVPSETELTQWIRDRCDQWCLDIVEPDRTVPIVMKRTGLRVGYVLHFLADAAARGRKLTPDRAEEFNLGPVD